MPYDYIMPLMILGLFLLFHERAFSDKSLLDHVKFSYECFDRVITNCMAKTLQYERGLYYYLFQQYGGISREIVKARTAHIHEQMEKLVEKNNLEIIKIDIGTNLLELATKEYRKLQPTSDDSDFIVAIFKQQAYSKCITFDPKEKKLDRKIKRVYHYTVYHFDKDFGLGSHTLNTYLPNNIRGYFNQHNWILQQLKRQGLFNDDIKMYYNSFQDIGDLDPKKFQQICDSITYDNIRQYDRKWVWNLWPELNNLDYESFINEAEIC